MEDVLLPGSHLNTERYHKKEFEVTFVRKIFGIACAQLAFIILFIYLVILSESIKTFLKESR